MELYHNELDGVNALRWETYPKVLHITDKAFSCVDMDQINQ